MKAAAIFLAAAFCFQGILSPIPTTIPKASATPLPCNEYYDLAELEISFSYAECANLILQPGIELSINISPDNVKYLIFKNSILPAIPSGTFTSFTKLAELYLNSNGLKTIVPGVFDGLTQLQLLHLQDNNIMKISKGTFNSLKNLKILDVSRNAIMSLERGCFEGLVNLSLLNLNRNNLYFLEPDTFVSLAVVEILDLSHNSLIMSEGNFTLNLETPYLEKLLINNNNLRHFSISSVENLNSLELLDVSFNALTEVDFGLSIFPKFANFSNNQICTVKGWSDLYQPNILDLSRNKINSSKQITGNTKKLYLRQNKMEVLDSFKFINPTEIIELDLSYNYITEIANDSLHGLINLETLYLNNNQIFYLPMGCFISLDSLKLLLLSQNDLEHLEDEIFTGLSKVTDLYLDHNRLSIINEKTFNGLNNLQNLYLNHNLLSSINIAILLKYLPNLNSVYLHNNQWNCRDVFDVAEALQDDWIEPEVNDFNTTQIISISICDGLTLKVISNMNSNKEFIYYLYKNCLYFCMLFSVISLNFLITAWCLKYFKVQIWQTEVEIKKIKITLTRI